MSKDLSTAKLLLADALGVGQSEISNDARITNTRNWDSVAHVRLMLAIEARLQRELDSEEAVEIESLKDIGALLDGRASDISTD